MNSLLVEEAATIVTEPNLLITLVSQRVKELNQGSSPLVQILPSMTTADIALTEVIEGKIRICEEDLI